MLIINAEKVEKDEKVRHCQRNKRVGFGSDMSFAINQADNKPIPSKSQNGKNHPRVQNLKFSVVRK